MALDLDAQASVALARARLDDPRFGATRRGEDPDLAEVATQFEALLMRQLVVAMREAGRLGGEREGDVLSDHLIEDALATHLARSGGVGLADVIVRDAEGPLRPNDAPYPELELGDLPFEVHDDVAAPAAQQLGAPAARPLAERLPPDRDPWLGDEDAAGTLRRLLGASAKKIESAP